MSAAVRPALLLDAGNTRLKWALVPQPYRGGCRFLASGAMPLEQLQGRALRVRRLLARVPRDGSILVCNVAGPAVERQLRALARAAQAPRPRFLRTVRAAGGVLNAYRDPWRLGVDRWSALIGARAEFPRRAVCLVAVGTAMTVDLLDAQGRHRGGCIIPGPDLMIDALLARTAGIRRRAGGRRAAHAARHMVARRGTLFARDTRRAVAGGVLHAASALIRESLHAGRQLLGRRPVLLVAGGAAAEVAQVLRTQYRRQDDLVLRGLAVLQSTAAQFA